MCDFVCDLFFVLFFTIIFDYSKQEIKQKKNLSNNIVYAFASIASKSFVNCSYRVRISDITSFQAIESIH